MACARLGGGVCPHRLRARAQSLRPPRRPQGTEDMNDVATLHIETPADAHAEGPSKIEINKLDFFYGKSKALNAVDLAVPANAVTAIIGPSGCGKSTLLRTIN